MAIQTVCSNSAMAFAMPIRYNRIDRTMSLGVMPVKSNMSTAKGDPCDSLSKKDMPMHVHMHTTTATSKRHVYFSPGTSSGNHRNDATEKL